MTASLSLQRLWLKKYARVEQQPMPQTHTLLLAPLIMSQVTIVQYYQLVNFFKAGSAPLRSFTNMGSLQLGSTQMALPVCSAHVAHLQASLAAWICV